MKLYIITIFLSFPFYYWAQEEIDTLNKDLQRPSMSVINLDNLQTKNEVNLKSYQKKTESNTNHFVKDTKKSQVILIGENTEQKTFESIDDYIFSLEMKIKETQADKEKHQLAIQNGWYTLMEKRIENAKEIKLKRSQE